MGQLSIYLPPFSSDYAGICSALFDFNCLVAINDANCCTLNYVDYDEPRWAVAKKTTLCTELRTIDAVFGNDAKVVSQVTEAAARLKPDFIAVLGSPVPAIIGMDMKGIASEIEITSGIPTFGFNSTGFSYYDKGVSAAAHALLERYAEKTVHKEPNGVNILGLTPLDYSANENSELLSAFLEDGGFEVVGSFFMQTNIEQLHRAGSAAVNLVVSASGLPTARYLKQRFGTPYVAASPQGLGYGKHILELLRRSAASGQDYAEKTQKAAEEACGEDYMEKMQNAAEGACGEGTAALLIVGDQIMASSLRSALCLAGDRRPITVASFFGCDEEIAQPGDLWLKDEKQLIDLLRSGRYGALVGDPLLQTIPESEGTMFFGLPHPVVSSRLNWDRVPLFAAAEFDSFLSMIVG